MSLFWDVRANGKAGFGHTLVCLLVGACNLMPDVKECLSRGKTVSNLLVKTFVVKYFNTKHINITLLKCYKPIHYKSYMSTANNAPDQRLGTGTTLNFLHHKQCIQTCSIYKIYIKIYKICNSHPHTETRIHPNQHLSHSFDVLLPVVSYGNDPQKECPSVSWMSSHSAYVYVM